MIFLDTHVVAWLYQHALQKIPDRVQQRLDREALAVSPFVQLELTFLYEIGKTLEPAANVLADLAARLELSVVDSSIATVCKTAQDLTWTRDPFDRLICAHAIAADMALVTKDRAIRNNVELAWWST